MKSGNYRRGSIINNHMNLDMKTELWKQFGAAIDMFESALVKCPESLWDDGQNFWYIAYHTLFYLDYYLWTEPDKFMPPESYTLSEFDPEGIMPERTYSKDELLSYVKLCRSRCHDLIAMLTPEKMEARWINQYRNYSIYEVILYNMRHVMHHTGQLNLMLGKIDHKLPLWVSQTKAEL